MKKSRNIFLTLLLLALLPLWAGCTKEDYRNCPAGLWILFDPVNPKHSYPDQVQNVSLYFYDPTTGELKADFHYKKEELRAEDRAAFIPYINSGTYRVVAIVNNDIYTETTGVENFSTIQTQLNEATMSNKPVDFYSAEKEITVSVNTNREIPEEVMKIVKHNNNVHLNIVYDGYVPTPGVTFESWMEGSNALFNYALRESDTSHRARYLPWNLQGSRAATEMPSRFSFTTMWLHHGSDITLHLRETGAIGAIGARHYSLNLTDELAKMLDDETNQKPYDTDEELEFNDEYELTVKLGKDHIRIEIGVDRWDTIGGGVEL